MHWNNIYWLRDMKAKYPEAFIGARVLELGSDGSFPEFRELFEDCEYLGIDMIEGEHGTVDLVVLASETDFDPGSFDTLLCFSMFEHDPTWRESLSHNLPAVRSGGFIFGCHGAEGNLHHGPEPWAIVPAQEALDFFATLPVSIEDSFFEEDRYGRDCQGAFDWFLIKK